MNKELGQEQFVQYKTWNFFSRFGLLVIIAAFVAFFGLMSPSFLTAQNWSALIVGQVGVLCVALGALSPLIAGEFDFSLGYMLGFCAMVGAVVAQTGAPAPAVILAVIGSGLLMGFVNGALSIFLKMNSTVVTLGMGLVMYGLIMALSDGHTITGNIPEVLQFIAKEKFLNINISIWIIVACAFGLFYFLEHTPMGKQMYATGLAPRASYLSGIRTKGLKIMSFMLAGFFVSLGALMLLGQSGSAKPATGPSYLMPAYAAVFLSITTHKAGQFNVLGLLVSILMLAIGFNGLSLLGLPFWIEAVFNGIILIVVILTTKSDSRGVKIG
ncbi:MAG: Autoinducer 2 import system permease protein LsrD [Desulfovibrio sp.]|uniref:ABC transporter permease n=1 Tax=Christensenella intestinihominis TaxID=1851429 RepID=UPI00082F32E5|nr:ABC transporter permease [Christensenella intestinihominis]